MQMGIQNQLMEGAGHSWSHLCKLGWTATEFFSQAVLQEAMGLGIWHFGGLMLSVWWHY